MIEYLYNYILNPIFFWYDIYYEYFFQKKKIEILPDFNNFYDIENDLIILNYINNEGLEYKLKINRKNEINLKKKIEKLKNIENRDLFANVAYNGNINITERALSIIGPNGEHNLLYKLKVRDLLNLKEINNFNEFEIMDKDCDIKFLHLDDYIL
jgi:hypothetical protein